MDAADITSVIRLYLLCLAVVVPVIGICRSAIRACEPHNRAVPTRLLWLNLLPIVNALWLFVTVIGTSISLRREFIVRNIDRGGRYARAIGCSAIIFSIACVWCFVSRSRPSRMLHVDYLEFGLVAAFLWVVYLIRIYSYTMQLIRDARGAYVDDSNQFGIQTHDDRG